MVTQNLKLGFVAEGKSNHCSLPHVLGPYAAAYARHHANFLIRALPEKTYSSPGVIVQVTEFKFRFYSLEQSSVMLGVLGDASRPRQLRQHAFARI
jgi:hypothetical protein